MGGSRSSQSLPQTVCLVVDLLAFDLPHNEYYYERCYVQKKVCEKQDLVGLAL